VFTEDALQPYTDGLEIKTDDQRLADVSTDFLEHAAQFPLPVINWTPNLLRGYSREGYPRMGDARNTLPATRVMTG